MRTKVVLERESILGVLVGACIVVAGALLMPGFHSPKNAQAGIEVAVFDPPSFNFGTVLQLVTLNHDFKLLNRTTNEIRVIGTRSSCQCTVIGNISEKTISPKGFLVVPVAFETGLNHGAGGAKLEVFLESRGVRFHTQAIVKAYVEPEFEFDPRVLDFGTMKASQSITKTITIVPRKEGNLTLKRPESTEMLKVLLRTNTPVSSSKVFDMQVTLCAPAVKCSQVINGEIHVETSSIRTPRISIPVSAVIRPELEIAPEIVVLPRGGTLGESRFTIRTLQPSRAVRALVTKSGMSKEAPAAVDTNSPEEPFATAHVCRIDNSLLWGAERIDFELVVRNGAGRQEARTVSIQVKRL